MLLCENGVTEMTRLWRNRADLLLVLILLLSIPLFFLFENITTLVWTIVVPLLPIAILVIGFSRWRNSCPLAEVSKISQRINWFDKKRVPQWIEDNLYLIQYFSLFLALTLRLTILNFNHFYLLAFFVFIFLSAFVINLIYTGKSWCNYFCPVGVVERIYCLSNANNHMRNSACTTCTACTKNCPDIDMENNYWKSSINTQKSFTFYSFSGLILGFYLYFYLQSGSFAYYFSGDWTSIHLSLFSEGFFFAPFIPVIIAVPLTLAFFALVSFFFFWGIEKYLWKKNLIKNLDLTTLKHRMNAVSSFVAFNTFYIFAGAPSYSQFPFFYSLLYFLIVAISSILLYKEFYRKEMDLFQERIALKIIKRWDKAKAIPTDLKEIYFSYNNETKNKKDVLNTYKESIEELLYDGILDENSLVSLEKLREQMGISKKDHFNIIRGIQLKNEKMFEDDFEKTSEKRYQVESYKGMILKALNSHTELEVDYIRSLQNQFQITDNEHKEIMHTIFNTEENVHDDICSLLARMDELIQIKQSIYNDDSREVAFLLYIIQSQFRVFTRKLFSLLFVIYKDHNEILRNLLNLAKGYQVPDTFEINEQTLSFMDSIIQQKILLLHTRFFEDTQPNNATNRVIIPKLIEYKSIEIATAALLCSFYKYKKTVKKIFLDKFLLDAKSEVNELAKKILNETENLTLYERMMYLSYVSIFDDIRLYDLKSLAESTNLQTFSKKEYVIRQGGVGDTLFILIQGKVAAEVDGKRVNTLGDRDYFGDIALIGDTKRSVSIKVLQDVRLLTISKKEFRHFLDENPKIYNKIMKNIINKLLQIQANVQ